MANYSLDIQGYRRRLNRPVPTAAGLWTHRSGIVVRLRDPDGRVGYGEVAPMDRAGCESIRQARARLKACEGVISDEAIDELSRDLPCCRFALASARWMITDPVVEYTFANTALLPSGEEAILGIERALDAGYQCFKLKIGMNQPNEFEVVSHVLDGVVRDRQLRLDANGSLTEAAMREWLEFIAGNPGVDFLEQPLPLGEEKPAAEIAQEFQTEVALDESVSEMGRLVTLCSSGIWKGPLVLKPLVLGDPEKITRLVGPLGNRVIVSSAFETGFGMHGTLRLAASMGVTDAVGYGTLDRFDDGLGGLPSAPTLSWEDLSEERLAELWTVLTKR